MPKRLSGTDRDWIFPLAIAFVLALIVAVAFDIKNSRQSVVEYQSNLQYEEVKDPTPLKDLFIPAEQVVY